jgi:hypothetical protein
MDETLKSIAEYFRNLHNEIEIESSFNSLIITTKDTILNIKFANNFYIFNYENLDAENEFFIMSFKNFIEFKTKFNLIINWEYFAEPNSDQF